MNTFNKSNSGESVNRFRRRSRPQYNTEASREALARAKEAVTIWEAWQRLGLPNPPMKDGSFSAPWREDSNPSLSITRGGRKFRDFTEDKSGDVVSFIERATGCSIGEAIRTLLSFAGMADSRTSVTHGAPRAVQAWPMRPVGTQTPKKKKPLPELREPASKELASLCRLRGLGPSFAGLEMMVRRGLLFASDHYPEHNSTGTFGKVPAFVFTDDSRRNAMSRRMDGLPWQCIGGAKSLTWGREEGAAHWPIGAQLLIDRPESTRLVVIVEGAPDLCAAHILLHDRFAENPEVMAQVVIVGMVSASSRIPTEALPLFANRRVLIVPHDDAKPGKVNAGENAAIKWHAQLHTVGVHASIFRLRAYLPEGGNDLCDAAAHAFACEPPHGDEGSEPVALTLSHHLFSVLPETNA